MSPCCVAKRGWLRYPAFHIAYLGTGCTTLTLNPWGQQPQQAGQPVPLALLFACSSVLHDSMILL
jgi:hypothetical protein